jgi:hypothetical protein
MDTKNASGTRATSAFATPTRARAITVSLSAALLIIGAVIIGTKQLYSNKIHKILAG